MILGIVLILILSACKGPLSPEQAAIRFKDCLYAADAQCLRDFNGDHFFEDNSMSNAEIEYFVKNLVIPRLNKEPKGSPKVTQTKFNEYEVHNFQWSRDSQFKVTVKVSPEGDIRESGFFGSMTLLAYIERGKRGLDKLRAF